MKAKFDWNIALVPKVSVGRSVYGGPDSVAISKGSRHPDAAWAFIAQVKINKQVHPTL